MEYNQKEDIMIKKYEQNKSIFSQSDFPKESENLFKKQSPQMENEPFYSNQPKDHSNKLAERSKSPQTNFAIFKSKRCFYKRNRRRRETSKAKRLCPQT